MATDTEDQKRADAAHDQARDAGLQRAKNLHEAGLPATYTIQPGDTYRSLSDELYGAQDDAKPHGQDGHDHPTHVERLYETNVADGRVSTDASILEPGTVIVVPVPIAAPDESDEEADARRDANAGAQAPVGPGAAVTGQPDDRDERIAALEAENERLRGDNRDASPT